METTQPVNDPDPYTDEDFKSVKAAVDNKTELDALVAYLQSLGKFAPKE